jgi:hypothetical protein
VRKLMLAASLAGVAGLSALVGTTSFSTTAEARPITWCARTSFNRAGDCMYYTYAQCIAAISGLPGECIRNPFVAYGYGPNPRVRRVYPY